MEKASEKIEDNIAQNEAQNSVKTPRAFSQEPSLPSLPSPSAKLSEKEKAEARAKYNDLSAKSTAESNRLSGEIKKLQGREGPRRRKGKS